MREAATPLAPAVQEVEMQSNFEDGQPAVHLKDVVALCTSYSKTGCALAWLIIAGDDGLVSDSTTQEFTAMWLQEIAKNKPAPPRGKGAAFPIREGELHELVTAFRGAALAKVVVEPLLSQWSGKAWVYLSICALNRLAGESVMPVTGRWSKTEREAVQSLTKAVSRRSDQHVVAPLTELEWQKELNSKRLGYGGEEISTCHQLTWDQIIPGLPPPEHGGCIDALLWVGPRTREMLLNPVSLLKPLDEVVLPKLPGKVHIDCGDKLKIAHELVRRNVCDWIPLDNVYKVGNTPILNGLFGVSKPSTLDDGRPILRFIMNLTGSNACQLQMEGGCASLPAITSWQSIVVENSETIKVFQSDMSSAFYLFRLPPVWKPFLAFNLCAQGSEIGGDPNTTFCLACSVIPMGWLNSVGIMQEISEALLGHDRLPQRNQITRNRLLPPWMNDILDKSLNENRSWWHIYLDNYAGGERLLPGETAAGAQWCHDAAEMAWREAGVASSAKKRVSGADRATELGAEVDGNMRTLGLSTLKLLKLIQSTLWLLAQQRLSRKHVQILAGRWVFALQFRRPSMGFLQQTWKFVGGSGFICASLRRRVRAELISLVFTAHLHHCFLGATISPHIVCTDASEKGGSVEVSKELSLEGADFLKSSQVVERSRESAVSPILLISLFNGIGGAFRCYDILNISPMGRIAVELDAAANRVTQRRWPGTILVHDVKEIDEAMVRQWSLKFLQVIEVHLWAGWPCVDLSSVRFGRLNLEGPHSSLFWEIPRIKKLLEEQFGPSVVVKYVLENVASMDQSAATQISEVIGSWPYKLDCVQAVPMRRPRFSWTSESLENTFPDVRVTQQRYWWEVEAFAPYPPTEAWLTEGYTWLGEHEGAVFPTCMKSLPRTVPPVKPAGLDKCSEATIKRWKEDQYRYPPYQYDRRFVITSPSTWRLLNATEKELLLGYGFNHTNLCWSASKQKGDPVGYSDCRHRLLGDSFSIFSFVLLAAACCRKFLPTIEYKMLVARMGLAPGFATLLRQRIPLSRSLNYGFFSLNPVNFEQGVEMVNRMLLRRTNHTGSDIRVVSGEVLNARAFPRQSVSASWWKWKHGFRVKWKQKAHINVLELEAILLGIKFQISRLKVVDARIFQLSDSYVGLSVTSKGRSSSCQLTRVLNMISAHLLAFGLHLIMGHIDSAENPSDYGSRN